MITMIGMVLPEEEKMTKRFSRVMAIVVFMLVLGCVSASAYSKSVIINLDGVPRMINTEEKTVRQLMSTIDDLMTADYILDGVDENTELTNNMEINLISVKEKLVKNTEVIEFDTKIEETDTLLKGQEEVFQEGEQGELTLTTKERYAGDELLSSEIVEEKVTKEAKDKIIRRGTKEPVKEVKEKAVTVSSTASANNSSSATLARLPGGTVSGIKYSSALNVKATGYTPYDPGCNTVTATGTEAKKGVIAVDPKVIPLGTRVYIPGYGYARAEDTGGAIKGNRIDLCYATQSEAYNWGVRNITLYILD